MTELTPQVPGEEPAPEATEAPKPAGKPAGKAAAGKPAKAEGLPDQSSVNPDKISRAVLTKQGWVVPTAKPKA